MIANKQKQNILENMIELLELPESAYDKAKKRYDDLGEWFGREDSLVKHYNPHIFPQGSFRLGTAIRPIEEDEAYDLDLACKLRDGFSKDSNAQKSLKELVGQELESYRNARGIKAPKEEKHRCWRLEYQDDLSFHMDIVPCIPESEKRHRLILESMTKAGESESIAGSASQLTVSITDDRHHGYNQICEDWEISNPEGYAKWFEYRMNSSEMQMLLEKAQVDDVPLFRRKTPLQRSIQLLKRHRDHMFNGNQDVKPISIIITTLAARAYNGAQDIESAMRNILSRMGDFVNNGFPRVPNPVDPIEDFADRWKTKEGIKLQLELNFWQWLKQAQIDFELLRSSDDMDFITEQAKQKFSLHMDADKLITRLGLAPAAITVVTPKAHSIKREESPKPWAEKTI